MMRPSGKLTLSSISVCREYLGEKSPVWISIVFCLFVYCWREADKSQAKPRQDLIRTDGSGKLALLAEEPSPPCPSLSRCWCLLNSTNQTDNHWQSPDRTADKDLIKRRTNISFNALRTSIWWSTIRFISGSEYGASALPTSQGSLLYFILFPSWVYRVLLVWAW